MIMPIGKSFVVLPHTTSAISAGSASGMPLSLKISIFAILFLLFIGESLMLFETIKNIVNYGGGDTEEYVLSCCLGAFWIGILTMLIGVWFL